MAYTNIDDPSAHFQAKTYTGNSTVNHSITNDGNSDMQPDLWWQINRDLGRGIYVADSIRGVSKYLYTFLDYAEATASNYVTSFDSDGFTLGNGDTAVNNNAQGFVTWQWKANGGTTASNTDGSITSTVQANQDAGFSIVTFTGNGTDGATVGHGLGAVPAMVLFKCRDTNNTDWRTYHQSISPTNAVSLNSTGAQYGASGVFGGTFTSTLLKVENDTGVNRNTSPMIAYCFAEKQGYSKFGKYIGNGSTNNAFVYTGFRPACVIIKCLFAASNWRIFDHKRLGYNPSNEKLYPNLANAEGTATEIDFLSNGFKIRSSDTDVGNNDAGGYIYMAWAENPFTTSTGVPTTAR